MDINDNLKMISLLETYGSMLTSKQYEIMTQYYFNNLGLSEIAENSGISRQAVKDSIVNASKTLTNLESNLHINEKFDIITKELKGIISNSSDATVVDSINSLIDFLRS